ncbi:MAG: hypothetical protein CSB21_00780 [Deltaproteobacteria bacterium]|nr:MAG: hypothetical protein CSB21_00780 [Deltaproteobacteria bacterium]
MGFIKVDGLLAVASKVNAFHIHNQVGGKGGKVHIFRDVQSVCACAAVNNGIMDVKDNGVIPLAAIEFVRAALAV